MQPVNDENHRARAGSDYACLGDGMSTARMVATQRAHGVSTPSFTDSTSTLTTPIVPPACTDCARAVSESPLAGLRKLILNSIVTATFPPGIIVVAAPPAA